MIRTILAVLTLVLATGSPGSAWAEVFGPKTLQLANGMEVVVIENHRAPAVVHMVWYKAGAADEPDGKTGVAHVLEHLMFKGTTKYPDGIFSRTLAQNGGTENAFTALDYTGYHQTVARDRLDMVMAMEADRMTGLILSEEDFQTERKVVQEERGQRIGNNPSGRLRIAVNAALFGRDHPYGRPVIGWEDELAALTRDDVMAFYASHYTPSNAVLVVAGDVTVAEVKALAETHYGPISARPVPPRPDLSVSRPGASDPVTLADPRVGQPTWSRQILTPSLTTGDPVGLVAMEVLSEALGGGTTSRLYRALVVDQALAVSAGTYVDSNARGPGRFVLYASPRPGVDLEQLPGAVDAVLAQVAQTLGEEELARVKGRLVAAAVYARDELKTGAWTLGGVLAAGHTIDDVERWPERLDAVTLNDVRGALTTVMTAPGRVESRLLPAVAGEAK